MRLFNRIIEVYVKILGSGSYEDEYENAMKKGIMHVHGKVKSNAEVRNNSAQNTVESIEYEDFY